MYAGQLRSHGEETGWCSLVRLRLRCECQRIRSVASFTGYPSRFGSRRRLVVIACPKCPHQRGRYARRLDPLENGQSNSYRSVSVRQRQRVALASVKPSGHEGRPRPSRHRGRLSCSWRLECAPIDPAYWNYAETFPAFKAAVGFNCQSLMCFSLLSLEDPPKLVNRKKCGDIAAWSERKAGQDARVSEQAVFQS